MSGIYTFYVGNFRGEQSEGYLTARKLLKLLKKQKKMCNIKYTEIPTKLNEGSTYHSYAPVIRITFD